MERGSCGEGMSLENMPETKLKLSEPEIAHAPLISEHGNNIPLIENKAFLMKQGNKEILDANKIEIPKEPISDRILGKIIHANINTGNGYTEAQRIIAELGIEDKNLQETVMIEAGIMEQLKMDEKMAIMEQRNADKRDKVSLIMRRVERTQAIEKFIIKHENEPEVLKTFWDHFDRIYASKQGKEKSNSMDKTGIKASLGAKKLLKEIGIYHHNSSAHEDVAEGFDGFVKVGDEIIPYQVKGHSFYPKPGSDKGERLNNFERETVDRQRIIEEEMISLVDGDLGLKIRHAQESKKEGRGIYDYSRISPLKKEIDQDKNEFWDKIISHNQNLKNKYRYNKGLFVVIPAGAAWDQDGKKINLIGDNGEIDERVKNLFIKRYEQRILGLDNTEKPSIINNRKSRRKK